MERHTKESALMALADYRAKLEDCRKRAEAAEAREAKLVEALADYKAYHDIDKAWHEARANGDSAKTVEESEKLAGVIASIESRAALASMKEEKSNYDPDSHIVHDDPKDSDDGC